MDSEQPEKRSMDSPEFIHAEYRKEARGIWKNLSAINVSQHIKTKNNLSYLSWPWAWATMMDHYPDAEYRFHTFDTGDGTRSECLAEPDGTATVFVTVTIGNVERTMWLPVMTGFTNKAVSSPTSRDIGDTKMRCLVKCFAMFGLGHYIYAGEDLPQDQDSVQRDPVQEPLDNAVPDDSDDTASVTLVFQEFLKGCTTIEKLENFWLENDTTLASLKNNNLPAYREILGSFAGKKKELKEN